MYSTAHNGEHYSLTLNGDICHLWLTRVTCLRRWPTCILICTYIHTDHQFWQSIQRQSPSRSQPPKTFKIPSKTPIAFNGITTIPSPRICGILNEQVRTELIKDYYGLRENMFRNEIKWFWSRGRYPLTFASQGSINLPNDATQLRLVCNKPTLLYWAQSRSSQGLLSRFLFRMYLYGVVSLSQHLPNLDFGHFFASPERILSTGPKSIAVILTAHKYSMQSADLDSRQHCSWRGRPGCWSALAGSIIL